MTNHISLENFKKSLTIHIEGTEAHCKFCGDLVFILTKTVCSGDILSTSQVDQTKGQAPFLYGEHLHCKKCGADLNFDLLKFISPYALKIGIVGLGFVGSTLKKWFEQNTVHKILCQDPMKDKFDDFEGVSAIFICIPIFASKTGQNLAALEGIVNRYKGMAEHIFIRSTVLPGTNDKLGTISMPEFFTQRTASKDIERLPILCGPCDLDLLKKLFNSKEIIQVSNFEAELTKYAHNCFGAMKVTYFNMINTIAKNNNADFEKIKLAMKITGYIDMDNHTQVPGPDGSYGYGGGCFPVNMESFREYLASNEYEYKDESDMLSSVINLNKNYRARK